MTTPLEMRRRAARMSANETLMAESYPMPAAEGIRNIPPVEIALPGYFIGIGCRRMYQVTFSDQAMRELNRLEKTTQLSVVEPISNITPENLTHPREPLGRFNRAGRTFYRLRAGDYRFYFEAGDETLHVDYILHKNSLEDFLLRNKLPVSEQQLVEQHSKFWKYLESLTK
jgi:mRNA interferase RelE/StbE